MDVDGLNVRGAVLSGLENAGFELVLLLLNLECCLFIGNQFCQVELSLVIADKLAAKAHEFTAAGALHISEEIDFFCLEYICHGAETLAVAFCLLLHAGIRVLQNLPAVG